MADRTETEISKSEVMTGNAVFSLPESKMPECWNDDMRMDYLFSHFRPQTVNPLDWESKMKFWTTVLEEWCVHNKTPMFTLSDLKRAFQRKCRTPVCLPTVIENMHRRGLLVVQAEFVHIPPQQTWSAWTIDLLVKKPIVWMFNKVKDSVIKTKDTAEDTAYVHVAACMELGNKLLASVNHKHLLSLNELAALYGQHDIIQLHMVVIGLYQQGKAAMKEGTDVLIKLGDTHISDTDLGVYTLRCNERKLVRHLEQLEAERQRMVQEARIFAGKNMRQAARSCLRKKHVLDSCVDKRTSALDNIHALLTHIEEAKSNAEVLEAYKLGVVALKSTLKESGLTEDSAADTMMQVEEVLDVHREIQATLAKTVEAEDDLECELAQLLTPEDTLEKQLKRLSVIADLPDPSGTMPSKPSYAKMPTMEPAL